MTYGYDSSNHTCNYDDGVGNHSYGENISADLLGLCRRHVGYVLVCVHLFVCSSPHPLISSDWHCSSIYPLLRSSAHPCHRPQAFCHRQQAARRQDTGPYSIDCGRAWAGLRVASGLATALLLHIHSCSATRRLHWRVTPARYFTSGVKVCR